MQGIAKAELKGFNYLYISEKKITPQRACSEETGEKYLPLG